PQPRAAAPHENGPRNVFLQATPIDVSQILRECLFSKLECAVLTSATLAVSGGFDYIRRRLGLEAPTTRELVVPSHFDYAKQAMLYLPPDLPDPRTPQFAARAAERIRAINAEGGNAFYDYQVPAAVISLKQGFGRLIRSLDDRGLLALLDNRLLKKAYGKVFLESLPAYRRTSELGEVAGFFSS